MGRYSRSPWADCKKRGDSLVFISEPLDIRSGGAAYFSFDMESPLSEIAQKILASYEVVGGLNNTDGLNLPSKTALSVICENLLRILFPGFHDEEAIRGNTVRELTLVRVGNVAHLLEQEITKSLKLQALECTGARKIVHDFLTAFPHLREVLQTDIEAAYEGDPAALSYEEIILSYPFLETIAIQRLAHLLHKAQVPILPRMMTEWAHGRSGIDIHPGATIGAYFFIDHGTGVVIGETCRIGDRVKLYHGVTLGARSFQKDAAGKIVKGGKRHPDVQNGVTIYPNSTVLGGETIIGEHSTIGANVFLMQSIPAHSLVFYEETQLKIIPKRERESEGELEWFI